MRRHCCAVAVVIALAGCGLHDSRRQSATMPSGIAVHLYHCDSGHSVTAAYQPPDTATVRYRDVVYRMHIARSADGARYVADNLQWWTRGSGAGSMGTLYRGDGTAPGGAMLERCTQAPTAGG